MNLTKYLPILSMVPGIAMVYGAKWFVNKYKLFEKVKVPDYDNMSDSQIEEYKFNRAILNFKMLGMLVLLPGIILVLLYSR